MLALVVSVPAVEDGCYMRHMNAHPDLVAA